MTIPAYVVFFAGLASLIAAYKRITGVWVSTPPRLFVAWGAVVLVVLVPAFWLTEGHDQRWAMVVAGAVLGVAAAVSSRLVGRAWVAELQRAELDAVR